MPSRKNIPFPTRDDILAYVKENPGKISRRDVARAFHIRGDKRVQLKKLLREMTEDGLLDKGHKGQLHTGGDLPPVGVVEITGIDRMGDLMARPVSWKFDTPPPPVTIFANDRRGNLGLRDQALVRLNRDRDSREVAYVASVIRKLERAATLVMGIFQKEDDNIAHVRPTDKKNRDHYLIAKSDWNGAKDGELVLVDARVAKTSRRHMGPPWTNQNPSV